MCVCVCVCVMKKFSVIQNQWTMYIYHVQLVLEACCLSVEASSLRGRVEERLVTARNGRISGRVAITTIAYSAVTESTGLAQDATGGRSSTAAFPVSLYPYLN